MRLIIRNTKEELSAINADIATAIGNGFEYLEEKYWLTKSIEPVQYAIWCSEHFKNEIISVIGQEEWDSSTVTANKNPEWYPNNKSKEDKLSEKV